MSATPLYQPWNENDFSADYDVQSMSHVQRWMYRTLCQKAFVCSTRPYLPNDDDLLWKLSGCPSKAFWNQQKRPVLRMFEQRILDGVKVLFRKRLVDDWENIQRVRRQNRENALRRTHPDLAGTDAKNGGSEARKLTQKEQGLHDTDRLPDAQRPHNDGSTTAPKEVSNESKEVSKENPAQKTARQDQHPPAQPAGVKSPSEKEIQDQIKIAARDQRIAKDQEVARELQVGKAIELQRQPIGHSDGREEFLSQLRIVAKKVSMP